MPSSLRFMLPNLLVAFAALLTACATSRFASGGLRFDLAALAQTPNPPVVNRAVSPLADNERRGIRFDSRPFDGLLWLPGVSFTTGVIEFDVRGKDEFQRSFVGLAFHGANDSTFEAVYFRPFNFRAADPVRRSHAVQYIAHPQHTWKRLRQEQPDVYEAGLSLAPDPAGWFHVRLVVQASQVQVFVNDATTPSLSVTPLRAALGQKIGLYVADNSDGDFANLRISSQM
jgi:hypothetical protein